MPIRRKELPIVGRCPVRVELGAAPDGRAWCDHCAQPVHVLSRLREHEVRALLAAHAGRSLCVEYRARTDGSVVLAPEPARAGLATALAGLAACASPTGAATTPPDDIAASDDAVGCTLPEPAIDTTTPSPTTGERVMRADFRIDEHEPAYRGAVVVSVSQETRIERRRSDRLEWIPTKTLWKEFVARVRARRARARA